jgi:hypothetical protein
MAVPIIALLAAACSEAPPPSHTSPPGTPLPSVATASPEPSSVAPIELRAGASALAAGTYTHHGFRPPVTFALGEGWFTGTLDNGFFDVQQDTGTPDVVAVQFARVTGLLSAGGSLAKATTAIAAASVIRQNPGLTVIDASDSRLGGLTGSNIVVENQSGSHSQILRVSLGTLGIDSGRRLWISLFDTADGLLAVMVGGSVSRWQHALDVAEPVLESIVIGDTAMPT